MTSLFDKKIEIGMALVLLLNGLLWFSMRDVQALWANVPPAPSVFASSGGTLGDTSFAYRSNGIMLQNLGEWDGAGRYLDDYNYAHLQDWLFLQHDLDPHSNHAPSLAAMYFGAANKAENLEYLVNYLYEAGNTPEGEKWRWLAQAIYFLRFKVGDHERAYKYALDLAALAAEKPDMPAWTRQMPAFIKNNMGEKQAAYEIMTRILEYEADHLDPAEAYHTAEYICTRILEPSQARDKPFCETFFDR